MKASFKNGGELEFESQDYRKKKDGMVEKAN
jgi:hypothetical protein